MSPIANFKSHLNICDTFPANSFDGNKDLLIVDERVFALITALRDWKYVYKVKAGEELKDIHRLPQHLEAILKIWKTPISRRSRIVACGGGSVGDFAGFVASILKRGVVFEQVPSTWLAAIDSAHGGKTALNVFGAKNQVGTFYPAQTVHLVRDLLLNQPGSRAIEGLGELVKIALIDRKLLFYALAEDSNLKPVDLLWRYLQRAVEIKYEIVLRDPYELEGLRKFLNFGHTLGHVLESYYQRPHGESVMQGLWFAMEWSHHKKILALDSWQKIQMALRKLGLTPWTETVDFVPMDVKRALQLLAQDKKINSNEQVDFIFLINVGKAVIQPVYAEEIMTEALRQGWARG